MINHLVGIGNLSQGFAFVSLLPARFFARTFAQALHSRRLLQPIARRRLSAVRTVQADLAFQLGDPRFRAALSALNAAISSSLDGSFGASRVILFLNRKPNPPSSEI